MQAIYELNPEAFEQQNINLLKDGSILKLPSERYIARVSTSTGATKGRNRFTKLSNLLTLLQIQMATTILLQTPQHLIKLKN